MAKKPDSGDDKQKPGDKIIQKGYGDYDLYNWAGQKTDSGADARRKGNDK